MDIQTRQIAAFNTVCTVSVYGSASATEALDALQVRCQHFEQLFSHTLSESSLVRLNNAEGAPVEVEPELAELLRAALGYCEATDGLFDITIGPVVELWQNSTQSTHIPPSPEALAEACSHVDWRKVHISGNTIQLEDPHARIVLGGIAKGYIADALCALLQRYGIQHAIVNLGGNVKVFGGKPDQRFAREVYGTPDQQALVPDEQGIVPFAVGLRMPQHFPAGQEQSFAAVQIRDGSVVTSGIYERGVRAEDGTFYHHILNPHTGMPTETNLVSASLISEKSLDGDGYTTALIAMGLQKAKEFVEALPGCEAVFVTTDGCIVCAPSKTSYPVSIL